MSEIGYWDDMSAPEIFNLIEEYPDKGKGRVIQNTAA